MCVRVTVLESSSKQGLPAVITEQATPTVSQSHFSSHRLEVQSYSSHFAMSRSSYPSAHGHTPSYRWEKRGIIRFHVFFPRSAASTVYPSALGADVRNSLLKQLIHIKQIPKSHFIKENESGQGLKNSLGRTPTHPLFSPPC